MKIKITALLLSVFALFALSLSACKEKPQTDKLPPDDENFEYTEITEGGTVVGYEISGISNYDQCPSQIVLPSYYKGKPVVSIGDGAFYEESLLKGVTVSDGIASIGVNAFYNCRNLLSLTVGDGVTVIGELAFADCTQLETVSLGNSVRTIDEYAFSQCSALKTINFPSSLESIGECAFVSCEKLESAVFSDGLKSIGTAAFAGCSALQSFIMPDSVTSIGLGVLMFTTLGAGFSGNGSVTNRLTQAVMSDNITEIPDYAFSQCNITSFVIGKSVETVRYSAFYGCTQLISLVIPESVTKVESYAFYGCLKLQSIFYAGTAEDWTRITIGKNGNECLIGNAEGADHAPRYYYSETQPAVGGNFWHYVNGKPVIW